MSENVMQFEPSPPGEMTRDEILLLRVLDEAQGPVGSRVATRWLGQHGAIVSEATTSRAFRRLDELGLSVPHGRKGRTLTDDGRVLIQTIKRNDERNEDFGRALKITSLQQVLDLLYARRGIEREATRCAAMRQNPEHVDAMRRIVSAHAQAFTSDGDTRGCGMEFHRAMVRASENALLQAMAGVVLDESLAPLEMILDLITGGHGTREAAVHEHADVLSAVERGDPDGAELLMVGHINRLIGEVESLMTSSSIDMVDRLLQMVQ